MTSFFGAPFRCGSYAILLYLFLALLLAQLGFVLVPALLFPGIGTLIVFGLGLVFLLLLWYLLRFLNWTDCYLANRLLYNSDFDPIMTSDGTRNHGDCGCLRRVFSWPHARLILNFGLLKYPLASLSAGLAYGLLALSIGLMGHEGLVLLDKDIFETKLNEELQRIFAGLPVSTVLNFIQTPLGRGVEAAVGLLLLLITFQIVIALGALNRGFMCLTGSKAPSKPGGILMKHFEDDGYTYGRESDYYSRAGSLNASTTSEVTLRMEGRGMQARGASHVNESLYSSIMSNRSVDESTSASVYDSRASGYTNFSRMSGEARGGRYARRR